MFEQVFQLAIVALVMFAASYAFTTAFEVYDTIKVAKREVAHLLNTAEQLIRAEGLQLKNLTVEQRKAFLDKAERLIEENKRKQP